MVSPATNRSLTPAAGVLKKPNEGFWKACGRAQNHCFLAKAQLKLFCDRVLQKFVSWSKCCCCVHKGSKNFRYLVTSSSFKGCPQHAATKSQGPVRETQVLFLLTDHYLENSGQNANPAAKPQTKNQKAGLISKQNKLYNITGCVCNGIVSWQEPLCLCYCSWMTFQTSWR